MDREADKEIQACRKRGGAIASPLQFLADKLTLSQPGGHIIPTQYYKPPRIFRPCDGPALLSNLREMKQCQLDHLKTTY